MKINGRVDRQKLFNFKVIFDYLIFVFISFSNKNINYIMQLMIISEIRSKRAHKSCYSSKFKAPADFSHHAILAKWLSLKRQKMKTNIFCIHYIFSLL